MQLAFFGGSVPKKGSPMEELYGAICFPRAHADPLEFIESLVRSCIKFKIYVSLDLALCLRSVCC